MKYATLRNDNNDYIYISKKNHGYYSHYEDKNIFDLFVHVLIQLKF